MTKIIGILNYSDGSFSDSIETISPSFGKKMALSLFSDGAHIVDIGAVPTSYGVKLLSQEDEISRLLPLLKECGSDKISIDTFRYDVAKMAVDCGVGYINDVSGGKDERIFELIAANKHIKYICMYSLVLPADRTTKVIDENEVIEWGLAIKEKAKKFGISSGQPSGQLILDPGIGFATNAKQSFGIIRNIAKIREIWGLEVCIGHSRKSFLSNISSFQPNQRDVETCAVSAFLFYQNVDYIRVHNVAMHARFFKVLRYIRDDV